MVCLRCERVWVLASACPKRSHLQVLLHWQPHCQNATHCVRHSSPLNLVASLSIKLVWFTLTTIQGQGWKTWRFENKVFHNDHNISALDHFVMTAGRNSKTRLKWQVALVGKPNLCNFPNRKTPVSNSSFLVNRGANTDANESMLVWTAADERG